MEKGFFKWVWRFNGLVIAIGATLFLGILVWEVSRDLRRSLNPQVTDVVAIPSPTRDGNALSPEAQDGRIHFGGSLQTNRKGLYALRVYREQSIETSYVSKDSSGNLVNYVIVDSNAGTTRPFFEGYDRLILDHFDFKTYPPRGESYNIGTILKVVEADSTQDGRLSRSDTFSIYFVDPEWTVPVLLLENITTLQHWHVNDIGGFDLIYTQVGDTFLQQFTLPNAEPGAQIKIDVP